MAVVFSGRFGPFSHFRASSYLKPVFLGLPTISGSKQVGQTLTAQPGTVQGSPAPTLTYQWLANGVAIPGATNPTYTVQAADAQKIITVAITLRNNFGTSTTTTPGQTIDPIIYQWVGAASQIYAVVGESGGGYTTATTMSKDGAVFASAYNGIITMYRMQGSTRIKISQTTIEYSDSYVMALSRNGNRLAVSVGGNVRANRSSKIKFYDRSGDQWVEIPNSTIMGSVNISLGYRSMQLSEDGSRVAYCYNSSSFIQGIVLLWSGSAWVQETGISSSSYGNSLGCSVAMNGDATRLVVGGYSYFQVYKRTGSTWTKFADSREQYGLEANLGTDVAISRDGTRVFASISNQNSQAQTQNSVRFYDIASANPPLVWIGDVSQPGQCCVNEMYISCSDDARRLVFAFAQNKFATVVTFTSAGNNYSTFQIGSNLLQPYRPVMSGDGNLVLVDSNLFKAR